MSTAVIECEAVQDALPVCLAPWIENPYRLVSLLDMLEFAASNFCRASGNFGQLFAQVKADSIPPSGSWGIIAGELGALERACAALGLTNTLAQIIRIKPIFCETPSPDVVYRDLARDIMEVHTRMIDELSSRKLFCLLQERTHYYAEPLAGWEEVINRFPDTRTDVEEAGRCFALDRDAACVFHCVQVIEIGLIALGSFLGVKDPKSGWTATSNELEKITRQKYADLTPFEAKHIAFLKQIQATIVALQDAWRNKISHAQGRLAIMTADFSPRVAEEILMASRGFMRRLATDLP